MNTTNDPIDAVTVGGTPLNEWDANTLADEMHLPPLDACEAEYIAEYLGERWVDPDDEDNYGGYRHTVKSRKQFA